MASFEARQTYIEFSAKLEEACGWLSDLGVQYSPTRLGRYRALWGRLAELQRAGDIAPFFNEFSFAQWVNAAIESSHVVEIWDGLRAQSSQALVERLRSSLRGYEMYVLDSDDRSGRDFTFELLVAARFGRNGHHVDLNAVADIEVAFNGTLLQVECKRLKSPKQVQKRVKEGIKQLHRRYVRCANPRTARGVLAISIAKLVNPDQGVLEADSPDSMLESASRYVARFIRSYQRYWQMGVDRRTLGAVVFLDAPGVLLPGKMLWSVSQIGVNNSVPPSSFEYQQLVQVANQALARRA